MPAGWRESESDAPVAGTGCFYLADARACNKLVYYSSSDIKPHRKERTLTCWHNSFGTGTVTK